jgi:2-methylcitrate dehydratase PrpD
MGIAAGGFEFEHVISNAHPASAMYPALLSVASAYPKTGEEFLVAMAVGYELATRIGAASTTEVETEGFS